MTGPQMEHPAERIYGWEADTTAALRILARANTLDGAIDNDEECYFLGADEPYAWVTGEQFASVLTTPMERDRYITVTNSTGTDENLELWSGHWNDPEYWAAAASAALEEGEVDGVYWTTRDEDPQTDVQTRAGLVSEWALAQAAEGRMARTPGNIGLLHDVVDAICDAYPDSTVGDLRFWPSATARESLGEHLTTAEIDEKTLYGGWDPAKNAFVRVNPDGDWVGVGRMEADRIAWDGRERILEGIDSYSAGLSPDIVDRVRHMAILESGPDQAMAAPTLPDPDPGAAHEWGVDAAGPCLGM